jgi:hypothetical protein
MKGETESKKGVQKRCSNKKQSFETPTESVFGIFPHFSHTLPIR